MKHLCLKIKGNHKIRIIIAQCQRLTFLSNKIPGAFGVIKIATPRPLSVYPFFYFIYVRQDEQHFLRRKQNLLSFMFTCCFVCIQDMVYGEESLWREGSMALLFGNFLDTYSVTSVLSEELKVLMYCFRRNAGNTVVNLSGDRQRFS